jgi:hypothetical protein
LQVVDQPLYQTVVIVVLRFLHGLASAVQYRFGCMHVAYLKVQMLGRADLDQLRPAQRRLDLPFAHPHLDLLDHTLEVLLEVVHAVSDESATLEVLSFKVAIRFLDSVTHLFNDRLAQPDAVRAVFGGQSELLTQVLLLLLG